PRYRRISFEQNRPLMRILKLTPRTEKWLLARRAQRDDEAQSVAAEIVADVRRRGDSALFAWSKKLDDLDLSRAGVWISREEIRSALKRSPALGERKRLPLSHMAQIRFRAWRKSSARATSTSPPPNNWSAAIAPSICRRAPRRRLYSPPPMAMLDGLLPICLPR